MVRVSRAESPSDPVELVNSSSDRVITFRSNSASFNILSLYGHPDTTTVRVLGSGGPQCTEVCETRTVRVALSHVPVSSHTS